MKGQGLTNSQIVPKLKAAHADVIYQRRKDLSSASSTFLNSRSTCVWEVGCGHGHFLTAYATQHPAEVCVGIDIIRDRIDRAERKRTRAKLANLHFLHADATDFLETMPGGASFSAIYMLFPDPWPKRRHHKHRLLEAGFLRAVAERAGQGVRFYFRTDHEPYFNDAKATFAAHPDWDTCPSEGWPFELPTIFQQKAAHFRSLVASRKSH
jgi:tRNA (guanine-N7-)-methyltransferase